MSIPVHMAFRSNARPPSSYSILSESAPGEPVERLGCDSLKNNKCKTRQSARSNSRTIWKSISHDCLPQLSQYSRGQVDATFVRPSSAFLNSSCSDVSYGGPITSKLNGDIPKINESVILSSYRRRFPDSCNLSPPATTSLYPDVFSPAPSFYAQKGRQEITRFSETHLPCSLTLDSFMDIESIDEPLLETTSETDYILLDPADKQNVLPSSLSSKVFWQSLAANGSAFLSTFESHIKRSSLTQSSLPSNPQSKRRAFLNLNHNKSRSLPSGQFASIVKQEPRLPLQPTTRIQRKVTPFLLKGVHQVLKIPSKLPALRKRFSAVFSSELWNQVYHPVNRDLAVSGTNQQELGPGITSDPFAKSLLPKASPAALRRPQTYAAEYHTAPPSLTCKHLSSICKQHFSHEDENRGVFPEGFNLLSDRTEVPMAATTPLLKNKPLPNIPMEQELKPRQFNVAEDDDPDDKATASSCLGSVTDCFEMLDAKWPEPPHHMVFLDPDMAKTLRNDQPVNNRMINTHPIDQYSNDSNTCKNYDLHNRRDELKAFVEELLSSVQIYINGSQVTSQPSLPSTLIFPAGTVIDAMKSGYTVQLTVRAPVSSLLVSFCTLYTDTTLTFEQQTSSVATGKVQVEISLKSVALPNQQRYEELSIVVPDKDTSKEAKNESGGHLPGILIELPCTLGELAIMITKMSMM